ncbi:MAG: DUF1616 domain-containing protein [Thermoproteota archaeon]
MSWVLDEEVLAVLAAILVVSIVFGVTQMVNAGRVVEPFSELGLLGPGGKIGDYPRQVVAGTPFLLHAYIGNHEGKTRYYRVLVKIGNRSTVVNETMPLTVEPMMDLRTVLTHNSSTIIPLNLAMPGPLTNARLVLELWVFNETSRVFEYHGRWNQLWLNVTSPVLGSSQAPQPAAISRKVEERLTEAYFAIRRAEESGGNVTVMVSKLNLAIEHAEKGEYEQAESLVQQVLTLEPETVQQGLETRRMQLINTIVAPGLIAGVALVLLIAFRNRVWLVFLKAYGDWGLVPVDKAGLGSTTLAKKVKGSFSQGRNLRVRDVVALGRGLGQEKWRVAREVFSWVRSKAVRLEDPDPPGSFAAYLLSIHSLGLTIVVILIGLTILAIYVLQAPLPRIVLGSLFVLFLPGYSLVDALYPRESDLTPLERLALSIGLSLALVPLAGLVLNYTPWGIRLDPVVFTLAVMTLSLEILASYRKHALLRLAATGG